MSDDSPAPQPTGPAGPWSGASTTAGRPPIVRLPTWVNVVLVLTLLGSCSAAGRAGDAVDQMVGGETTNAASEDEVREMCRLMGAVAAKQGIDLDATFADGGGSICAAAAREAATP